MLRLYVDESGSKSFNDPHGNYFIVSGVIINPNHKDYIRHYAGFVKQKHFGSSNRVFHATDIFKRHARGLKTSRRSFYADLLFMLEAAKCEVILVAVDKPSYRAKGFRAVNVHHDAYHMLFKAYLRRIVTKTRENRDNRGQICLEQAEINGDLEIHKIYNGILSGLWQRYGFTANMVRKYIVSLKFVTKHNLDIEIQLADIFACAYAKYISHNYSDTEQQELIEKIVKIAKKKKFMFTDFEDSKRKSSLVDIS